MRPIPRPTSVVATIAAVVVWALVSLVIAISIFLHSSRTIVVATHDSQVSPTFDGYVVLHTGPVLPDLRLATGSRIGVAVTVGKTEAESLDELVTRYAYIASQPQGQIDKVSEAIRDMAVTAALRGAVLGLVPLLVWWAVGARRREELTHHVRRLRILEIGLVLAVAVVAWWQPWDNDDQTVSESQDWMPLGEFLGPDVTLPEELAGVEVFGDVTTEQTRRLIESAISTYDKSKSFYEQAARYAADLDLRVPEDDETVVALVSDRHDNIGMDPVARAIADAGRATAVFNAGDDTSVGKSWETFSLDSVTSAFEGLDRFGVAGNHDHGSFVSSYLADHGWTMLDGEVVTGPGDIALLGVDDPRSSGLGNWRDETGLSFSEVGSRLADAACASAEDGQRVATILVHDANLGREALERGCVDLVVGGHTHVRAGPTPVAGENGAMGYTYTTGTTGGAAYAIAIGSKPRRAADVSLLTYRDGRPVGVQWVTLQTNGIFEVGDYVPLSPLDPPETP